MRAFLLVIACALCMCGRSALGVAHDDTDASATRDDAATDTQSSSSSSSSGGGDDASTMPDVVVPTESGAPGCPTSCPMLDFPCAPAGDGDGVCLGAGDAGCTPSPCPPSACGMIDDGCGGKIDCGECFWSCVLSGP